MKKLISFNVTFLCLCFVLISPSYANPQGGVVNAGSATISNPSPGAVQINQTTNKAVIDWRTFNIGVNEHTHFQQPSASSITLNRINPNYGASSILGRLSANGQIWLINPAGILFGATARVDAAGLLATTANITNTDFMSGNYHFVQSPDWNGAVINRGMITIADNGIAALVAPGVENTGVIRANLGKVALAAGNEFVVDFYGDQLIHFGVNSEIQRPAVDPGGRPLQHAVSNTGKIIANGGKVLIAASTAEKILNNSINMQGFVEAKAAKQRNGEIVLMADNGNIQVSGKLIASGRKAGEKGGTVKILTRGNIALSDKAVIDVSGDAGGGTVLVGGNKQGKGPEPNARSTTVGKDVSIYADAITQGNGGTVIVWGNDSTAFSGSIFARGGIEGGNGGFVETSGKYLSVNGLVNTFAPKGKMGTWLLDPINVVICNAGSSPSCTADSNATYTAPNYQPTNTATSPSLIFVTNLQNNLATSNVVVTTTPVSGTGTDAGNITISAAITWSSANTLTLQAANDIAINAAITTGAAGSGLVLNAGGNVTQAAIIAGSGGLTLQSAGATTLNLANTYTGATIINSGTVVISTIGNTGTSTSLGNSSGAISLGNATLRYVGVGNSSLRPINLTGAGTIEASGTGTLTLSGGVTGTQNLTLTGTGNGVESGVINTTTGSLTKSATGTWILSGANSYTGTTTINAGTLQIGSGGTAGALGTGGNVINNGTLTFNRSNAISVNNAISGTGNLNQNGGSNLTLSGTNSYTGATFVNTGTLVLTNANALGSGASQSSGVNIASGATLNMNFATNTLGNTNTITLNGTGVSGVGALTASTSTETLNNNILIAGNTSIGGANNMILNGIISDGGNSFSLTKIGNGTITLGGVNTYGGGTTINTATLALTNANALGTAGNIAINNAGILSFNLGSNTLANGNTIAISGTGALTNTVGTGLTDTLNNSINLTSTTTSITSTTAGATLVLGGNISNGTTGLTFTGAGNTIVSGVIGNGVGNVTKAGAGTLTFNNANTYTGNTAINAGTLNANNANALGGASSGAISVATASILGLNLGGNTLANANTITLTGTAAIVDNAASGVTDTLNNAITLTAGTPSITATSSGSLFALGGNITNNTATLTLTGAGDINVNGIIGAGTGGVTKAGSGTVTFNNGNTYTGVTSVTGGILKMGIANAINANSAVVMSNVTGALLNLNNFNVAIGSLATGGANGGNVSLGSGTLTTGDNNTSTTYTGVISGIGNFIKTGTGTMTLAGANAYTGTTSITNGILSLSTINGLGSGATQSSSISVSSGGALNTRFNGTLANTNSISLNGSGPAGAGAITSSTNSGTLTNVITLTGDTTIGGTNNLIINGGITGNFNLTKEGANTATLGGPNSFTGTTTVNSGTLTISNANALGSGTTQSSGISVASGAVLNMNFATNTLGNTNTITLNGTGSGAGALIASTSTETLNNNIVLTGNTTVGGTRNMVLNGIISDDGNNYNLTKTGSGIITLGGVNTFTGGTTVNTGTLGLTNANALSTLGNIAINNAAILTMNLGGNALTNANTIAIAGTGALTDTAASGLTDTLNNPINLTSSATTITSSNTGATFALAGNISNDNTSLTLSGSGNIVASGVIGNGAGTLTKLGTGAATLSNANTYTGATTITAGVLNITNTNALGNAGGGSISVGTGATLSFNLSGGVLANANTITLNGTGSITDAALSGVTDTINNQLILAAASTPTVSSSNAGGLFLLTGNITNNNATFSIANSGDVTLSGIIGSGSGGITKSGLGTLSLNGANSYTGSTLINGGSVIVNNASGLGDISGATTIAANGTLVINNIAIGNESINLNNLATLIGKGSAVLQGNISLGGTLTASRTIATNASNDSLTLQGSINGAAPLIFSGPGTINMDGTVGDTTPLSSITSNSGGTLNINNGNMQSSGSQTYNSIVGLGGNTIFNVTGANASVLLLNTANNFTDTPTFSTSGAGTLATVAVTNASANAVFPVLASVPTNLTLNFINKAIDLPALTLSGTLNITSGGDVTQSGSLVISGVTTIAADSHNIALNDSANNFSTFTVSSGNNVSVRDVNALILGAANIAGNYNVNTGGAITENGAQNVVGATTLDAGSTANNITLNTFTNSFGTVAISQARNVTLLNGDTITLGPSTISGTLSVTTSSGNIAQSSPISVTGATSLSADNIDLTDSNNFTGAVSATSNGNVAISDLNTLFLGITNVSGNYTITAGGSITQSGATILTVTGTPTFTVTVPNSDILLDNANVLLSTPIFTNNGNIRDVFLRNTAATASVPVLPNNLRNLTLSFNNSGIDLPALTLTGTLTTTSLNDTNITGNVMTGGVVTSIVSNGSFVVGDNNTLSTNNAMIGITATDLNLNNSGSINSGSAATNITQNTNNGSLGLGDTSGNMTISGSELQRIFAGSLGLNVSNNSQILVDNITAVESANIAGTTTLTATAGTTGNISFVNHSSVFAHALNVVTDNLLTVNDNVGISTVDNALSITALDLNLNTTGFLNAGLGNLSISDSVPAATAIELGNSSGNVGTMNISGSELRRIIANNLNISTGSSADVITIDGIQAADAPNIAGTLTVTVTAGTTGNIIAQNNSSTFDVPFSAVAKNNFTVNDGVTLATSDKALFITAEDLNLNTAGALSSGTAAIAITQNTPGGSLGLGSTSGTMTISQSELQRISAGSLSLYSPSNGQIIVDNIAASNTANISGITTLNATAGTASSISILNNPSTFMNGVNAISDTTFTVGDGAALNTVNSPLSITAADIDLSTTGLLNSGNGDISITNATPAGVIELGNSSGAPGVMGISGSELQRITAANLSLLTSANGQIAVDDVTSANSANISNLVTLDTTAGSLGNIVFRNNASQFRSLSGLADAGITVNANAGITTSVGSLTLNADVNGTGGDSLNLDTNLTSVGAMTLSAASGGIIFASAIQLSGNGVTLTDAANGGFDVTINPGSGVASIQGIIGGTTPLSSLTVNGEAETTVSTITTTGAQTYTGNLTLDSGLTLNSLNNADIQLNQINGAANLVVNTGGTTSFNGAIGSITPLNNLTTDASGSTVINTSNIAANTSLNFSDPVLLATDVSMIMNNGNVTFNNKVDSQTNTPHALTITADVGNINLNNTIGGIHPLLSFNASNSGATRSISLPSDINTINDINLTAGNNVSLSTGNLFSSAGNIYITATGGVLQESGTGTINGNSLTVQADNGISLANNNVVNSFSATNNTSGGIVFNNISSLLTITGISQNSGGNVAITNTGEMTVSGNMATMGGNVNLSTLSSDANDRVLRLNGGITTLGGNIFASAANPNNASDALIINGLLNTTGSGNQGTLTVGGGIEINTAPILGSGDITLQGNGLDLTLGNLTFNNSIAFAVNRYVIVNGAVVTTGAGHNLSLIGDNDNTGIGGVLVRSTGSLNSAGSLTLSGSSLSGLSGADQSAAIELQAGASVSAAGAITLSGNIGNGNIVVNTPVQTTNGSITITHAGSGAALLGANITANGSVFIGAPVIINSAIKIDSGAFSSSFGNLSGSNSVTLNSGDLSVGSFSGNLDIVINSVGNVSLLNDSTVNSLTINTVNNFTNSGTLTANLFTQYAGSGTTNLGVLNTPGMTYIVTNNSIGSMNTGGLTLGVNTANLFGSISGSTGRAAINKIIELNSFAAGTHFWDGIDMVEQPVPPPPPHPHVKPISPATILDPAIIFPYSLYFVSASQAFIADDMDSIAAFLQGPILLKPENKKHEGHLACVGYGGVIAVCGNAD